MLNLDGIGVHSSIVRYLSQAVAQCRQQGSHVALCRAVAHQADSPGLARKDTQSAADFDVIVG